MKSYWSLAFGFIRNVLKVPEPGRRVEAIVPNRWSRDEVGPPVACAFIRHAYRAHDRHFSLVDTQGKQYVTSLVFRETLHNFRSAVLRYGMNIKVFRVRRRYTEMKMHVALETLEAFPELITIKPDSYDFELAPDFQRAISETDRKVAQWKARPLLAHRQGAVVLP